MAIDDNTSYELTGAQVKDLANKIKAKADDNIFVGATSAIPGSKGLVPAPQAGDNTKFLAGDGTWATPAGGSPTTFYVNEDIFDATLVNVYFYKDSSLTTAATFLEIYTAASTNGAILSYHESGHDSDSQYVVTTFSYDPYWNTYKFGVVNEVTRGGTGVPAMVFFSGAGTDTYSGKYRYVSERQLTAGSNISINLSNGTISATDTTYSNFTGATSSVAGTAGLVPAPAAGDEGKALHGDGTWKDTTAKLVEMAYGESNAWAKFIAAYQAGSIVYCRASSNANPATGSQTRKAFMAYVNNATSPTSVEFQYVRSVSSKSSSQPVDQVFVYTLTSSNGGTWSVATRDMGPKLAAGTNTSVSYSSGTYTVSANVPELNYSTSEVDTGTTWIDGSHIYKKTVDFGALPNAGLKTVAHNITNLYRVIKYECMSYNSTSGNNTKIPLVSTVGNNSSLDINSTDVVMNTNTDRSSFDECYITIYYTKSS